MNLSRVFHTSLYTLVILAVWMLALGWKKILMTAMPASVCDSM